MSLTVSLIHLRASTIVTSAGHFDLRSEWAQTKTLYWSEMTRLIPLARSSSIWSACTSRHPSIMCAYRVHQTPTIVSPYEMYMYSCWFDAFLSFSRWKFTEPQTYTYTCVSIRTSAVCVCQNDRLLMALLTIRHFWNKSKIKSNVHFTLQLLISIRSRFTSTSIYCCEWHSIYLFSVDFYYYYY